MDRHRRVLGVAVSSRKLGFAYLIDGELMDWGASRSASKSVEGTFALVTKWAVQYQPDILVAERVGDDSRKGSYTRQLIEAIESAALHADRPFESVTRPSEGQNKFVDAAALAKEFPQIAAWLPKPRKLWEPEPRNIIHFEALALARAWWRKEGGRGAEAPEKKGEGT